GLVVIGAGSSEAKRADLPEVVGLLLNDRRRRGGRPDCRGAGAHRAEKQRRLGESVRLPGKATPGSSSRPPVSGAVVGAHLPARRRRPTSKTSARFPLPSWSVIQSLLGTPASFPPHCYQAIWSRLGLRDGEGPR